MRVVLTGRVSAGHRRRAAQNGRFDVAMVRSEYGGGRAGRRIGSVIAGVAVIAVATGVVVLHVVGKCGRRDGGDGSFR